MRVLAFVALAVVVAASAAAVDFAGARYARALVEPRAHAASRWSVVQGIVGSVGFIVAVKVTLWTLPFEALGWYLGTYLAARKPKGQARG